MHNYTFFSQHSYKVCNEKNVIHTLNSSNCNVLDEINNTVLITDSTIVLKLSMSQILFC